jgi:hypothetical protein
LRYIIRKKRKGGRGQELELYGPRNENYSSDKTHHWQCHKLTRQTSIAPE